MHYVSSRKNHEKFYCIPLGLTVLVQVQLPNPGNLPLPVNHHIRPVFVVRGTPPVPKLLQQVKLQKSTRRVLSSWDPDQTDLQPSTPWKLEVREIRWDPSMEKQHRPQSGHPANLRQAGKIKLFQSRCHWKCGCLISLKHTDFMQPCILKTSKKSAQLEWRGWTKSSQNWGINYTHALSRKCHIPREFPETVWAKKTKKKTWRQFAWKFTPKASTPPKSSPDFSC